MIDIKISDVGAGYWDLEIVDGDLQLIGDTEETWPVFVAQNIAYKTKTWRGESAFDRSVGFPWEQSVFGLEPIDGIGALVYDAIMSAEGVDALEDAPDITFDPASGVLSIVARPRGLAFEVPVEVVI